MAPGLGDALRVTVVFNRAGNKRTVTNCPLKAASLPVTTMRPSVDWIATPEADPVSLAGPRAGSETPFVPKVVSSAPVVV